MADQARLQETLDTLNGMLGDFTPYKLAAVPPGEIEHVDKNAHYMPTATYRQLVDNIAQDGNLSSLPFCWRRQDGVFVALSGNHRVDAARDAGVPLMLVLYTDADLSRSQQIGIQLSHNAIFGQDNPKTLRELWREIDDLKFKVYSGLDEKLLETMEPAKVFRIAEDGLRFEELRFLFMAAEIERLQGALKRIGKKRVNLARLEDFDRFFDALLDFKEAENIVNSSTAVLVMAKIVEQWLAEHYATEQEGDST